MLGLLLGTFPGPNHGGESQRKSSKQMIHLAPLAPVPLITFEASQWYLQRPRLQPFKLHRLYYYN